MYEHMGGVEVEDCQKPHFVCAGARQEFQHPRPMWTRKTGNLSGQTMFYMGIKRKPFGNKEISPSNFGATNF